MQTPTNSDAPRALVAHSCGLVRHALVTGVLPAVGLRAGGEAASAAEARQRFTVDRPAVVLLELDLGGSGEGLELLKGFRKADRAARTLVVGAPAEAATMQRAFRAGAGGYSVRGDGPAEVAALLAQMMLAAHSGGGGDPIVSPAMGTAALRWLVAEPGGAMDRAALSDRESQVFSLVGRGWGPTRIASELGISPKTVETHHERIKRKLGLRDGAGLARAARRAAAKGRKLPG